MKDDMKDIDQLFREKLGASSGKFQVGYWTKMEALLIGHGTSALWRNLRNASMLLLLAGILAIDFFAPKNALRYNPANTTVQSAEMPETTFTISAEPVVESQVLVTETSNQNNVVPEQTKIPSPNPGKKETSVASKVISKQPKKQSSAVGKANELDNEKNIAQLEQEIISREGENKTEQKEYIQEVDVNAYEKRGASVVIKEEEVIENAGIEKSEETPVLTAEEWIDPLQVKDITRRFYLGAMAYGGSALRMIQSSDATLEARKTFEEQAGLYASGQISLGYSFGKWSISTGFGQWTQEEKLSYSNQLNGEQLFENGYWDVNTQNITNIDSNWVIVGIYQGYWNYDTTSYTLTDSTYITQWDTAFGAYDTSMAAYNGTHRLRYFEVPVIAGYRLPLSKFDLEFSAGISVGFFASSSGKSYLNQDQSGVLTNQGQHALFRSPIYSALFGVGIVYPISRHWELLAQAQGRYTLNSVVNTSGWSQRYLQYGLGLGVRYRF